MKAPALALSILLAFVGLESVGGAQTDSMRSSDAPSIAVGHRAPTKATVEENKTEAALALKNHVVRIQVWPKSCSSTKCVRHYRATNSRVNAGASAVANNISGTQVAVFKYIALSTDAATPGASDTTCPSEISTGGLGRAAGTFGNYTAPSALNGTASYTITASYTATSSYTINKLCMFNAASVGTMLFETLLGASVTGNNGDSITVTWTVNE